MSVVLNDLFDYNLKIYQNDTKFKFSLDSLLLAEFIDVKKSDQQILDLCCGNCPVPLILVKKYNKKVYGVELQPEVYNLARKTIEYNKYENLIEVLNINAKLTNNYFPGNNFDIISCNPPFFKTNNTDLINENISKAISRHELTITIEEIISISSNLLKNHGAFYLVHRPERLEEIIVLCNKYKLAVKEICIIYSNIKKNAIIILIKCIKNGNQGLKISSKEINRDIKTYQNIFERRV